LKFISYLKRCLLWLRRFGAIATKHPDWDSNGSARCHEAQKDGLESNLLRMHDFLRSAARQFLDPHLTRQALQPEPSIFVTGARRCWVMSGYGFLMSASLPKELTQELSVVGS
jgi:hypothetical protein